MRGEPWRVDTFEHTYPLNCIKVSPKFESICVFCKMENEDDPEANAEEYVIVYSMAKEDV